MAKSEQIVDIIRRWVLAATRAGKPKLELRHAPCRQRRDSHSRRECRTREALGRRIACDAACERRESFRREGVSRCRRPCGRAPRLAALEVSVNAPTVIWRADISASSPARKPKSPGRVCTEFGNERQRAVADRRRSDAQEVLAALQMKAALEHAGHLRASAAAADILRQRTPAPNSDDARTLHRCDDGFHFLGRQAATHMCTHS